MRVLGIETSCDETGVALVDTTPWEAGEPAGKGLISQALYSQVAMHVDYGGVVPELASRDHIRRILPLINQVVKESGGQLSDIDAIAYTQGPGLAGALLVGASVAKGIALGLQSWQSLWLPQHPTAVGHPSSFDPHIKSQQGLGQRRLGLRHGPRAHACPASGDNIQACKPNKDKARS